MLPNSRVYITPKQPSRFFKWPDVVSKLVVAFSSQGVNLLFKMFTEEGVITVGAGRV